MLIRPAVLADIPAVLLMVAKIYALHEALDSAKYGFLPEQTQRYEQWLMGRITDERSVFLIADPELPYPEAPAGLAAFLVATTEREIPIYRLQEFGFIQDLWVEPEYRHAGIARQMVMLTVDYFKHRGVKQVRLDTAVPNEAARQLFKSCGFRPSMIEMLIELED
jgi:ribosomal protein S18 acetylase RimI-like enzyme